MFVFFRATVIADCHTCVRTPPCAIACIYSTRAHVKDPVVHVRVRWIMETLKHPACTVDWVARLCRSWLSPGKAARISHGRNPNGRTQCNTHKQTNKPTKNQQKISHNNTILETIFSMAGIICWRINPTLNVRRHVGPTPGNDGASPPKNERAGKLTFHSTKEQLS